MKQLLAGLTQAWKEGAKVAKENGRGGFTRHPDGRYLTRLTSAKIATSQKGDLQMVMVYTIMAGPLIGKFQYHYQSLATERGPEIAAGIVARFGYDPEEVKPEDLLTILPSLAERKPYVSIDLKTREGSDYQNTYIRRVFPADWTPSDEDLEAAAAEGGEVDEDIDAPVAASATATTTPADDIDAPAAEEEETVEESAELKVGDVVQFTSAKDGLVKGPVTEINEAAGKVKVKANNKVYSVPAEKISFATDDEEVIE